jgi:hypothetical protein
MDTLRDGVRFPKNTGVSFASKQVIINSEIPEIRIKEAIA